ncbi:MAG: GDSL-type esterase/lipase family protein [Phycisphaerae bacterium]|jgi:lysophospholipase L1-like esterase|nr:GDSL-type esterase/lipase family protein [Phycisphaerae bacterium]
MNERMLRRIVVVGILCSIAATCAAGEFPALKKNDRIVFLGDSITAAGARRGGYVTLTGQALKKTHASLDIEVIGAGISGHKVPDCQKRLERDVLKKKPTIVVIYIGINDVWHWNRNRGTKKEDFESGLHDLIKRINGVGARVIMCTPTVIGEKTDGTNKFDKMLDEYSDISRKVARDTKSQMLDLRKEFLAYLKTNNTANAPRGILTGDTVHLNKKGNEFLAGLMLKALGARAATRPPLKKDDRIIFLGDSITAAGVRPNGYVTLTAKAIEKAHPALNIKIIGAGIGGHKVPNCQKRLERDVLKKKPTIVVIYIGINDVWHGARGTKKEDFESGLNDMIKRINAVGARVILCTPTVIGEKTDGSNKFDKLLDEYSDISRKVAATTNSQMLDLRKGFLAYLKKNNTANAVKGVLTADTVHLNKKGNEFLASLVLDALGVACK